MVLHRGGERKANRAVNMIAVMRLRYDARTIDYMQRRLTEGLSKKDVLRCLKRFIAREVFNDLKTDRGTASHLKDRPRTFQLADTGIA